MIEENVQVGSGVSGVVEQVKPKTNRAKTIKVTWEKIRGDFVNGRYRSIMQLAETYGVHHESLRTRIDREGWEAVRDENLAKISTAITAQTISETDEWLQRVKARGRKDWDIVDKSVDGLGGEVDPDSMSGYMRSRKIIDDMVRRSLGLRDEMDVTSGGKPIGESLVSALKSLRDQKDIPTITSEDVSTIIDAEIVE